MNDLRIEYLLEDLVDGQERIIEALYNSNGYNDSWDDTGHISDSVYELINNIQTNSDKTHELLSGLTKAVDENTAAIKDLLGAVIVEEERIESSEGLPKVVPVKALRISQS